LVISRLYAIEPEFGNKEEAKAVATATEVAAAGAPSNKNEWWTLQNAWGKLAGGSSRHRSRCCGKSRFVCVAASPVSEDAEELNPGVLWALWVRRALPSSIAVARFPPPARA